MYEVYFLPSRQMELIEKQLMPPELTSQILFLYCCQVGVHSIPHYISMPPILSHCLS